MTNTKNVVTYGRKKEREEGSIITSANAVIHPLAMVVAIVHAVVALQNTTPTGNKDYG